MNILKITRLIALSILLMTSASLSERAFAQPGVSVPIEAFYNELAPYGQWLQYPAYGYVWLPNAEPNFQPYVTAGHWVMTEYGNTWVSDYLWGWAPFHYGRWLFDQAYGGWLWVPGSDWAPAWVDWRSGGGYYGWAPLGPTWGGQVNIPAPFWTFVPQAYITSPYVYQYYVPRPNVINIYQRTTIINNVYRSNSWAYNYGPPRREIERITRQPVQVYRVDRLDRPGRTVVGNGSIGFYRPGPGAVRRDGPGYGRNDRFDNPGGANYGGNVPSGRGGYNSNNNVPRDYPGNTNVPRNYPGNNVPSQEYSTAPGRNYDGNPINSGRGSYGTNAPANPGGSYSPQSTPNNPPANRWDNNRSFDNSRGGYSPGPAPQGSYSQGEAPQQSQPSSRPFDRIERSGSVTPQSLPGAQGNGGLQRTEGRGGFGQPQTPSQPNQAPGARSGNSSGSNPFGGERGGRGPR